MVCTGNYKNFNALSFNSISISGDKGKDASYTGECYSNLAPKKEFWRKWKDNRGKVPFEENTKFYIREYWNQVLSKLDPEKVSKDVDNKILLCYEDSDDFCHRHIVASWLELFLGDSVPEVVRDGYQLKEVERPTYVKEYLEETIKSSIDMKGFNSLRALYLYNKSEQLEEKADKLEKETEYHYNNLRQLAAFLRSDADMAEEEYILSKNKKNKAKQD